MAFEMAFPLLVTLFFFVGAFLLVGHHLRSQRAQRGLPSRDTWLASRGEAGASCARCDSYETEERGLDDKDDTVRVVSCANCKALLYRFDRNPGDGGS